MVMTRSMSKADSTTADSTTAVRAANKQTRKKARKNDGVANKQTRKKARKNDNDGGGYLYRPIGLSAMSLFMLDYMDRHPDSNLDFDALDEAGQKEWAQMSALEKEPYIKTVMEKRETRLWH